ncbi:uncharacterized protein LOC110007635 isoform X3 [Amborella trichopoda]|uniref:uncharacterized protein LOC110007635 isoform X3 n=1 Tax=Amborella trichopoda TaxID=13333 RepID=UPI0009C0364E|nr:uncharacterized protein LOC110007635 isoform X3 [Amborella trichopoda]|eukprot:XP_020525589.1 uncharacterized protein LOC110007635 isoform X3 [Amborella trichopoda]
MFTTIMYSIFGLLGNSCESMELFFNIKHNSLVNASGRQAFRNSSLMNEVLLIKWWWRSLCFKDQLCCKVLTAKYGVDNYGIWIGDSRRSKLMSVFWKDIFLFKAYLHRDIRWCMGNGAQIPFWHHKWLGDSLLKIAFPELFAKTSYPNALISDTYQVVWDIQFPYNHVNDNMVAHITGLLAHL